ncbi:hypothetical protein [Rummeliibacillus pycnus]|uniref:hypothetical protein n=1 Tax=Rummeliibacillus pycnus TaxID=101070 RepID=UPI0037C7363D
MFYLIITFLLPIILSILTAIVDDNSAYMGLLLALTFFSYGLSVILIIWGVIDNNEKKSEAINDKFGEAIWKFKHLNETRCFVSPKKIARIGMDTENKRVTIIQGYYVNEYDYNSYYYKDHIIDFNNIMETEIIQNGVLITETSRGSQLGGAIVGGVLAGGVGAVIGGLSGSTKTEEETKSIELGIFVNDLENPYYKITFYSQYSSEAENISKERALQECKEWFSILKYIINQD